MQPLTAETLSPGTARPRGLSLGGGADRREDGRWSPGLFSTSSPHPWGLIIATWDVRGSLVTTSAGAQLVSRLVKRHRLSMLDGQTPCERTRRRPRFRIPGEYRSFGYPETAPDLLQLLDLPHTQSQVR